MQILVMTLQLSEKYKINLKIATQCCVFFTSLAYIKYIVNTVHCTMGTLTVHFVYCHCTVWHCICCVINKSYIIKIFPIDFVIFTIFFYLKSQNKSQWKYCE